MAELFYLIGASGVGKDSLISYARQSMKTDAKVVFAHRYITRPADAGGENHIALSRGEFARRAQLGCFAMRWHSHDTWYAIGIEIEQWLELGLSVVINGSRAYLEVAQSSYPQLTPVLVSASVDRLRARLLSRGRESAEEIEKRLIQAALLERNIEHPRLVKLSNDGSLAEAGDCLIELISGVKERLCI
ncbi:MAG: phosphonate metabolism protein/1,5-bisphosphokinase (PRPP-forming) PhnN [Candidatus Thiodiazotropha sp.]